MTRIHKIDIHMSQTKQENYKSHNKLTQIENIQNKLSF